LKVSVYRPISDENIECLKEQLSNFNWNTVLSSNDPHYVSYQFLKTVQDVQEIKKVSNPTLANIQNNKTYKNDLKKLKRTAKQTYYKNMLGINYSNPKKNLANSEFP
jgi:hypothetical protein